VSHQAPAFLTSHHLGQPESRGNDTRIWAGGRLVFGAVSQK